MANKSYFEDNPIGNKGREKYTYTPFTYDDYETSTEVKNSLKKKINAEKALANYGDFSYSKSGLFDDVMNKILDPKKFSYDVNGDALYQQYKDKYIQQGKMAMADTMGQAAAMTGGYGNSYAASVGNQAYQASLQSLNDVIPELYQMAYDRYSQERQDLYNRYGMLSDDRSMEYGMWGDKRNALVTDRDYYGTEYNNAFNRDYGIYSSDRTLAHNEHTTSEGYKYQDIADANAYAQWEASHNLAKEQFELQKAQSGASRGSDGTYTVPSSPPSTKMSTDDYDYWSSAFSDVTTPEQAMALRDQMAIAVGDTSMAYELYHQWETRNNASGNRTDTTVYRGTNGQTHMVN